MTVALDSGVVIAVSKGNARALALIKAFHERGDELLIPAPVFTEVLRGGRSDAAINRFAKRCAVESVSGPAARAAGASLGRTGLSPVHAMDALIVETAIDARCEMIVTVDELDIELLTAGRAVVLPIR